MNGLTRRQMFKAMAVTAGAVTLGTGARIASATTGTGTEIRVLSFNICLDGTTILGGLKQVADIITSTRANVVLLAESKNATKSLATTLTNAGTKFYAASAPDTGILSQFPISETANFDWMNKAVITVDGIEIATYSAHLNYEYYATYLPRGYGPGAKSGEFSQFKWNKMSGGPVTDLAKIERNNLDSGRPQTITNFINDAALEQAKGRSIILGGDFNEPSHLDWTDATKNLFDHNDVVIPWETTRRLEQAGFADSYRSKYPNPVTHPGFTWPSDNPAKSLSQLTWAPAADERDRIDFIFTDSASKLSLTEAGIVGPLKTIVRNQRVAETSQDNFIASPTPWPTDHKTVLAVYQLNTVIPDAETTTTVVAPDSVTNGAEVTLTANIAPAAPGGTVQFLDGTIPLGDPITVANGTASTTHTFSTDGAHPIIAAYSGSTGFLESTSEIKTITVSTDNIVTTTTMTAPDTAYVGQDVNLHAKVSPAVQGGTVEFTVDGGAKVTGTLSTDGTSVAPYTFTTVGIHSVVARYSGIAGVEASVAPAFQVDVSVAPPKDVQTTTTLDPVGTVAKGAPVSLKATVDPVNAKGKVQFKIGDTVLGAPVTVVNGVATLPTTFAASGTFSVTAEFIATTGFIDSASTPQTLTVPGEPDPGTNPGTGGIFGSLGNLGNLFGS